jgi:predicted metal-dependent hydrolase
MTAGPLAVRRVHFAYPDDLDPEWNPRFPEFACAANSVSLLMPFAEPYFVRSVRTALDDLPDPLRSDTDAWLRQELQHHVQHRRFNDLLLARHPRLRRVERWERRTYGWLGRTRTPNFNLAFAAGSETIAYSLARWSERHLAALFGDADPVATTLYLWHLAEEVEHKSVAFDVYQELDGAKLRYTWAMTASFGLLALFTALATLVMLASTHRLHRPVTWFRLTRWAVSLAFTVLPDMLASALPGHHPRDFADPVLLSSWLRYFDPETGTMPVWSSAAVRDG